MEEEYFSESVREKLIIAGADEISRHGLTNFSLRRVAAACNISCAAPYKHFKNKEELILEIMKKTVFEKDTILPLLQQSKERFRQMFINSGHGASVMRIGAHTSARPDVESYGGWWTQADDMKATLRLISLGRFNVKELIEETHLPEECAEVYARLAKNPTFPIVQFDWTL